LRQLIDDAQHSIDHQSYPADELAVAFITASSPCIRFRAATAGGPASQAICFHPTRRPVFHVASGLSLDLPLPFTA
jgi:hypothetical protein